jgi:hypothetical protein
LTHNVCVFAAVNRSLSALCWGVRQTPIYSAIPPPNPVFVMYQSTYYFIWSSPSCQSRWPLLDNGLPKRVPQCAINVFVFNSLLLCYFLHTVIFCFFSSNRRLNGRYRSLNIRPPVDYHSYRTLEGFKSLATGNDLCQMFERSETTV